MGLSRWKGGFREDGDACVTSHQYFLGPASRPMRNQQVYYWLLFHCAIEAEKVLIAVWVILQIKNEVLDF